MKNLPRFLLLAIVILSFALTSTSDSFENGTTTSEISTEVGALYCSITVNGKTSTCWCCDCAELIKTLKATK